jgi:SAM-dependent methyltransferase
MQLHPTRDSVTLDFYSASAPVYVASGTRGVSRHLPSFLDLLPPQARILELGCGGGWDAGAMIAAGFDVDPTDGTPEIARKAEERLGRRVRVMRFDELDALEVYDATWEREPVARAPKFLAANPCSCLQGAETRRPTLRKLQGWGRRRA